ncbi:MULTISPECIES: LysR family transcriptional regulator [unclassified Pseudomonas]|uniref:LysR family transcriptional regulator n=1 Tax=unclassified Pseudomonas TaxID=196821 RepID=UPI000875FDA1|nr:MULTISPECIES: LysR family transcriptional regulator [unclassified Pseudomonas]SCZ20972.1 DNA-binding transcriptional regulator, LysR family [Pseudomonas sp. NFACC44-2]SDA43405.1 DNA-binding transcriptional regulator, LysR family [Pseudomonas sp. NFACC51]SFH10958.1 DNA-binding transcriptional regulator, LysR family [Pseudomonas sp. NFACC54]SFS44476.1 DNA-binding transcriptional regulator, LysR family [Pseudomonas sp. NFACC48-1]
MSLVQDRRILYFFEAVRLGSVRAAADFLNVAPSAVSRQISQLEQELGAPLLERHRRGVKPTEAGDRVLGYYRQRLTHQELLLDSLQALRGLQSGSVVLAVGEGFIDGLAGPLSNFSALYPKVEIQVNVCGSNEVIRQVVEDEAHLGLVFNPAADPKIRTHASQPQPVRVIVNPQHPLAQTKSPIPLEGLDSYRLALPGVSFGIRQILTLAEHQLGVMLNPTLTCNTIAMLKRYSMQGGVTLLPTFVVDEEVEAGRLCTLALHNEIFASPRVHLISRLGRQLSVGSSRLLTMLLLDMSAFKSR